ncbi:MAG: efflux transporter periplasmic adaptor subunit [Desulfuromonadales bacterium GWD2_61_12]|nr:MAG: efflux transporter periplasmic adaptor subunit [Desulfuromonadales bacterium GWC2_61_20]OGR36162.1 MAG: efflux transporter periplasmic adaptor subunit [Desulfuromonadales bacterium GWD2_61_12]HAD05019.1 efflux RND transporter periplasmic adaptor subunit [Desulfuromonas sp.]HBT83036.1 efflux RND transporter periplasmic adaptor subunit [Desulfuromonas sp.]
MSAIDLHRLKIAKSPDQSATRRRRRRWWRAALVAGLGLSLVGSVLFLRSRPVEIETVTVSQVYPAQSITLLNASGYVVAQRKAAVAAKITGRLEWLGVEEGSRVTTGQELARLDQREAAAALEQARANLRSAEAGLAQAVAEADDADLALRRMETLRREAFVSQAELDSSRARAERARATVAAGDAGIGSARAAVHGAEVAYDNTVIRAPFDAVVLTKDADLGDIVTPFGSVASSKASVVSIADLSSLQIEADVAESNLEKLAVGQPCEIQLDALPGSRFPGFLQTIVPTADRSKATVMVKIRFTELDRRILPEMSARVAFLQRPLTAAENAPKTALPVAAIVEKDGGQQVYVVSGDRVSLTRIETGAAIGDLLEVISGVKAGSRIAIRPLEKLADNRRIVTVER